MAMLDIKNLEKLTTEQRAQFDALLSQFPHLNSKMETSRELNTPSKFEQEKIPQPLAVDNEIDYSTFMPEPTERTIKKEEFPNLKINPDDASFASLSHEVEIRKPTPEELAKKEQVRKQQQVKAAIAAGQSPEIAGFNTEGKAHPVLQKLRATVGLRSMQEPVVVDIGGCRYSMRPLDRRAITNATVFAMSMTHNPIMYETNLETAIIAYSVVAIDNVPLTDVFSIPTADLENTSYTQLRREEMAAEALYTELLKSPNELIETLGTYYQQEFPVLNLIGAGKAKYLCPAAQCLQSRIADLDATCYCPVHGGKMAREDQIPNPS